MSSVSPRTPGAASDGAEVDGARRWRAPTADGGSPWTELGLQPRREELDALREAARAEGHAAGLAEGRAEIDAQRARFEALLDAATAGLSRTQAPLVDELTRIVLTATRCVLREEARLRPELVAASLSAALGELADDERDIVLRINPEDQSVIEAALADGPFRERITVLETPDLERGGIDLVCGPTRIDDTVETRLAAVFAPLLSRADAPA